MKARRSPSVSVCEVRRVRSGVVNSPENSDADLADYADNPLGGVPVPQFRRAGRFPITAQDSTKCLKDASLVGTDHGIRSTSDGNGTFGIVAQRKARDSENRGFFLKTARVSQNH